MQRPNSNNGGMTGKRIGEGSGRDNETKKSAEIIRFSFVILQGHSVCGGSGDRTTTKGTRHVPFSRLNSATSLTTIPVARPSLTTSAIFVSRLLSRL